MWHFQFVAPLFSLYKASQVFIKVLSLVLALLCAQTTLLVRQCPADYAESAKHQLDPEPPEVSYESLSLLKVPLMVCCLTRVWSIQ